MQVTDEIAHGRIAAEGRPEDIDALLEKVEIDEGWSLIERFSKLVRESGTADEREGADYIVDRLKALGVPVEVHFPELLISLPRGASLQVEHSAGNESFQAKTSSFSLSTDGRPVSGEVVFLPARQARGAADLFDVHLEQTRSELEVSGKIVLTEGYAMPSTVRLLERLGARAQIYIHPGRRIHEGICTTIWGTPTPESVGRKPSTPIVCINRPDGDHLANLALHQGPLQATLTTRLEEGWKRCPLPVAHIPGNVEPDEFLLVHGHYDSWHEGIGDNATGNAALLELARIFHQGRSRLYRSLRIAWWPGHSTGRYAGSTWFADTFALDLRENCVGQVNIDSPGCRGAVDFEEVMWMMECDRLCREAIRDRTSKEPGRMRPLRAGDYSFNQIGLSSFFMLLSHRPKAERERLGFYPVGGCGGDIAWHTEDDGLAVADAGILRQDIEIYVAAIGRVLTRPALLWDFRPVADELLEALQLYAQQAQDRFSLEEPAQRVRRLKGALQRFHARMEKDLSSLEAESADAESDPRAAARRVRRFNRVLIELARRLVPILYARGERFDIDPAESLRPIPKLSAIARLAQLDPESDEFKFLSTQLVRDRNKVCNALYEALLLVEDEPERTQGA